MCARQAIALLWTAQLLACSKTTFTADAAPTDAGTFADVGQVGDAYVNPCAPSPPPAVTGKVVAPNGVDPVAGAHVYVPLALPVLPPSVRCESCGPSGKPAVATTSGADGSFRLERVPAKPFKLALQKGLFRRVIDVTPADACGVTALPLAQTQLPGRNGQYSSLDTAPRVAVVSGVWDRLEKVLDKLGVGEKTIYNGRDPGTGPESVQALLQNGALLRSHHMLFVNCGTQFEALVATPGPARNVLRDYVRQGGRLFATDLSYDFVEQTFPEMIDFVRSDSTPATQAEEPNAAEVGTQAASVAGDVLDAQLRAWLALPEIGALLGDGKVDLVGFKTGFAVIDSVNVALGAKVWVAGNVTWAGGTGARPLVVSFDFADADRLGCGRVFFSSPHTHGDGAALLPQERILEYLMLEVSTCPLVK